MSTNEVPDKYKRKICNVKQNKTFKSAVKKNDIVKVIVADLRRSGVISKTDQGLICRACNLIENLVSKKDHIDKFDLLVDVYKDLLGPLAQADIDAMKKIVQFCIDSKMVHKVSSLVKLFTYCRNVFIHNFLFR